MRTYPAESYSYSNDWNSLINRQCAEIACDGSCRTEGRTMTMKEIIQLATVLQAQVEPLLRPHRAESPRLLECPAPASEPSGLLEVAFDERFRVLKNLATWFKTPGTAG